MAAIELFDTYLYDDADLKSYYRLEADSTDSKGLNTGTDTSMTYGAGKFNNGAIFNGSTGRISLGTSKFNHTTMTICFWLVNKGTDKTGYLIARNRDADRWASMAILMHASTIRLVTNDDVGVTQLGCATYASLTNGDHLAFVLKSDGTAKFYKNGALQTPTDTLTGFGAWNANITEELAIGQAGAFNNYYFDGKIDDLAFFSRELTSVEIADIYNGTSNGAPVTSTGAFFQFL